MILKNVNATGIDLFAGAGGTSTGATMAGVDMLWAGNHDPEAVKFHALNNPTIQHICQDLHQADWSAIPSHDITFASPCCSGHSRAAGKATRTNKADKSRSTAWAVVSCLEAQRSEVAIIENVADFLKWKLFDAWVYALKSLGYSISVNRINAIDLGVPQNRPRVFIIATRSRHPIELKLDNETHLAARTIIDTNFEGHIWDHVSNRVEATQKRVVNGRNRFGEIFLDAAYGSEKGGRSIDKPIGTITTVNKHSLVIGNYMRPITIKEQAAAQTFPDDYIFPSKNTITKRLIGNAVPPIMAKKLTLAVLNAA